MLLVVISKIIYYSLPSFDVLPVFSLWTQLGTCLKNHLYLHCGQFHQRIPISQHTSLQSNIPMFVINRYNIIYGRHCMMPWIWYFLKFDDTPISDFYLSWASRITYSSFCASMLYLIKIFLVSVSVSKIK